MDHSTDSNALEGLFTTQNSDSSLHLPLPPLRKMTLRDVLQRLPPLVSNPRCCAHLILLQWRPFVVLARCAAALIACHPRMAPVRTCLPMVSWPDLHRPTLADRGTGVDLGESTTEARHLDDLEELSRALGPNRNFDRLESEGDNRPAGEITIYDDSDSDESYSDKGTSEVAGSAEVITPV